MIPGIELELAGTVYIVPPLTLASMEKLQGQLSAFDGTMQPDSVKTVIDCAYLAIKRNYPDITREQVAEMIDLSDMADVMAAVMRVSGIKKKEAGAGK